ncbi:uncharacterized protein VICG_00204 [Vittaforma corneae ATCC 50505]|uniref:Uncharacterized protein n=1 Tax=Vittaforma corneae (strain ATCC 50505) TaxID=993615 RepID=L2GQI3_VITCO|nr:uncharacterized protein VICG_00204 [Vittaforma corneae ATCC 50505]ELA42889.1 hypothetical protein VICG_00204 [Vittaforma corneae ATCC 50505]
MEIHQLAEISEKIYGDLQALLPADIKAIECILQKESIKYGKIRTFNLEDSQDIVLLTMKQNCLILIKHLLENEISVPDNLLNAVYKLVNLKQTYLSSSFEASSTNDKPTQRKSMDLHAQIEKERIIDSILNLLVDIVFISRYRSEDLANFLKSKKVPDEFSVNLAIAIDQELDLESFELAVLTKKLLGPVFLSLAKSYRGSMRKLTKKKIIDIASRCIDTKDRHVAFKLFYYLNEEPHRNILVNTKPESSPEYFGFASSLVMDKESAEIVYAKLEPYFDDLVEALQTLLSFPKHEEKSIQPRDEKMIRYLLECINSISRFKSLIFFKFVSLLQGILKIKVSKEIKGTIYDILSKYVDERDLYVGKVVECRDDVEMEIKTKDFYLLPRLIKFLNSYQRREQREIELVNIGVLLGSPYITDTDKSNAAYIDSSEKYDFRVLGLKSEDPTTVIECLDCYISPDVLKMYSVHLRNAMVKDVAVIDKIIDFQIEHHSPIDDISIVNSILSHSSPRFFEYARLFKDFSFYLNSDVLERISEDPENGTEWIKECYNKEFGLFILHNCGYFNDLLRGSSAMQPGLSLVYEKILDENLGNVEVRVFNGRDESESRHSTIYLFDNQEVLTETFFRIFAKQLIYCKFFRVGENIGHTVLKKYISPFYSCYVKAKAVCGLDVSSDIQFMKKNLLADDDLLGYLKTVGCYSPETEVCSSSILLNFGIRDNSIFVKNFPGASDFEKFILFFNIEHVSKDIDIIIKDEIMKNLKNPNRLYLRMCILQLFRTKELDQIIKVLEKNFEDKELLFKLCMHNVMHGGRYFSKDLILYGDEVLRSKALFLLYYLSIWDKEYLREMIEKADAEASEDMKYLTEDIGSY